jgi:thiamine-monophosphate kinase
MRKHSTHSKKRAQAGSKQRSKKRTAAATRARTVGDVGEFGLIARIQQRVARAGLGVGGAVRLGIGDDAALVRPRPGFEVAVSADTLVEGVHFRREAMSARLVGQRALAVNLSDLAAMGARPVGFTWALQAPASLELRWLEGVVAGLLDEAVAHQAPLIGGNVARARETALAITVLGEVECGRALRRDGLRAGDRLFVSGPLGGAALALARSERAGARLRHRPMARIWMGRTLLKLGRCSACIDVSDGLVADLGHMLEASGVAARVDPAAIPRARGLARGARALGLDPDRLALAGGEDYELLFGWRPGPGRGQNPSVETLRRRLKGPISEIGVVVGAGHGHGLPAFEGHRHF